MEQREALPLDAKGDIITLAFSEDGTLLAAGDRDGRVAVWRTASTKPLFEWQQHSQAVTAVSFTPDGKALPKKKFGRLVGKHRREGEIVGGNLPPLFDGEDRSSVLRLSDNHLQRNIPLGCVLERQPSNMSGRTRPLRTSVGGDLRDLRTFVWRACAPIHIDKCSLQKLAGPTQPLHSKIIPYLSSGAPCYLVYVGVCGVACFLGGSIRDARSQPRRSPET